MRAASDNQPLPREELQRVADCPDWRAQGDLLSVLIEKHDEGQWGFQTSVLQQVAEAFGRHPTHMANILTVVRWLRTNFPEALGSDRSSFPLRNAMELRALWGKDRRSAKLISADVFDGRVGPAKIRAALQLAESPELASTPEEVAQQENNHAKLATQMRRNAVVQAVRQKCFVGNGSCSLEFSKLRLPPGLCDVALENGSGDLTLVHLAMLPAPKASSSEKLVLSLASHVRLMMDYGRSICVMGNYHYWIARGAMDILEDRNPGGALMLIARWRDQNEADVCALSEVPDDWKTLGGRDPY